MKKENDNILVCKECGEIIKFLIVLKYDDSFTYKCKCKKGCKSEDLIKYGEYIRIKKLEKILKNE